MNLEGRKIRTLPTSKSRRFPVDFPGWGAPNAADTLLDPQPGLVGTITCEESHGSNPWTRYSVLYQDGTRNSGTVLGRDIELVGDDLPIGAAVRPTPGHRIEGTNPATGRPKYATGKGVVVDVTTEGYHGDVAVVEWTNGVKSYHSAKLALNIEADV